LESTAAGKVILACCSDEELKVLCGKDNLKKYSEQKSSCLSTWLDEQERIRESGFAISIGEYETGANAVAAAIRNHASQVIGVINVVGPSFRLTHELISDEVASLVVKAAMEISLRMGYVEPAGQKLFLQEKHSYVGIPQSNLNKSDRCWYSPCP
jgi:DNA-binding IclR family transcriptional regulator